MNRKRSFFNMAAYILNKVIIISFGLILPRLFITNFGSEVNGLFSAVNNIFIYINLLEGGISLSATQSLYKPIAENDNLKVNSILGAVSNAYRNIGIYVLACTVAIALLYPLLLNSSIDYWTIVAVILIQGFVTVLDYFVQAKNRVLLHAEAKSYVVTNVNTSMSILTSIAKIILILLGSNIIFIQIAFALISLLKILIFKLYIDHNYKYLKNKTEPDNTAISNKGYAFTHNTVFVISSNIDILVLTLFTDLKVVSVYAIYQMIYTSVSMFPETLINSFNASLGQLYMKSKEVFIKKFEAFERLYIFISFSLYTAACLLTMPFIKLYTSGVSDIDYAIQMLPFLFMLVKLLNSIRILNTKVIHYSGHFKQTMKPAIVEIIINILLSIALVIPLGIRGVLIATIVSSIYRVIKYIIYTNDILLCREKKSLFILYIIHLLISLALILGSIFITFNIINFIQFLICALIVTIVVAIIFVGINILYQKEKWLSILNYLKKRKLNNTKE